MSCAAAQVTAVEMTAGDWKFTANGNVNVHYIGSNCESETTAAIAGGLACRGSAGEDRTSQRRQSEPATRRRSAEHCARDHGNRYAASLHACQHRTHRFLAQFTYKFDELKLGVNYGESTVGAYYSLTKNLTLLAEFTETKSEAHNGVDNDSSNFNVGAYFSF